jgi:hypothetical protein
MVKITPLLKKTGKVSLYLVGVLVVYFILMLLFFGTPKTSYWIDDPTYGKVRYFHFKAGNDRWEQYLRDEEPAAADVSYRLAIVELDEFGDFFQSQTDRSRPEDYQLSCAKDMLREASAAEKKPVLMFLFVHGWRHDASHEDENLNGFKKLLGYVAQSNWGTNQFAVCGVYVSWRGASIKHWGWLTEPAEFLSFWSRKSVAEKIASTPASSALFGLTEVARSATPDPVNNPSRVVLAGHSLGAGILMNSVSQALAYEYARAESEARRTGASTPTLESPANLILLLNPAFESVYLRQLRIYVPAENWHGYPWLVSLTSETDLATKYVFPLAQTFRFSSEARPQPYREVDWSQYHPVDSLTSSPPAEPTDVSQRIYTKNTPGHNAHMRDLRVVIKPNTAAQIANLQKNHADTNDVIGYGFRYGRQSYFLLKGDRGSSCYGYFDTVRPKSEVHPLFWVATVDPMIIDGHGLPFDEGTRRDNFLATIMTLISDSRVQHPNAAPGKVPVPAAPRRPHKPAVKRS